MRVGAINVFFIIDEIVPELVSIAEPAAELELKNCDENLLQFSPSVQGANATNLASLSAAVADEANMFEGA